MKRILIVLSLVAACTLGCAKLAPPSVELVRMDLQFEAIAFDRLLKYIDADESLSPTELSTMRNMLEQVCKTWASAAKDHGLPAPTCLAAFPAPSP